MIEVITLQARLCLESRFEAEALRPSLRLVFMCVCADLLLQREHKSVYTVTLQRLVPLMGT